MAKRPVTERTDEKSAKAERLSAALRKNLKRRKAQARGRSKKDEGPLEKITTGGDNNC